MCSCAARVLVVDRSTFRPEASLSALLQREHVGVLHRRAAAVCFRLRAARRLRAPAPRPGARSSPSSMTRAQPAPDRLTPISARAWPAVSLPDRDQVLHVLRQLQSAAACWRRGCGSCRRPSRHRPGYGRTRRSAPVAARLLDRVEVLALHVLDDRDLERLVVGDLDRHDRHVVQAGALRRAPAPLAGDDLEVVRRAGTAARGSAGSRRSRGSMRPAPRARPRRNSCADCADWARSEFDRHAALRARRSPSPLVADVADQRREAPPSRDRASSAIAASLELNACTPVTLFERWLSLRAARARAG